MNLPHPRPEPLSDEAAAHILKLLHVVPSQRRNAASNSIVRACSRMSLCS